GRALKQFQKQIAYVEQRKDLDLTFPINVFDVVLTGTYGKLGFFREPSKADRARCQAALEQLALTDLADRQISQLSGG
ncbi:manganese ABC transporter ATP-binding protein, partial [Mycobacterium kansasii]